MKKLFTLLFAPGRLALAVAIGLLLTTTAAQATYSRGNLIQRLQSDGRFNTLLVALEVAGLKDTVATGGTFTILAPTDAAFAALPPGTVESLVTNVPALQNILLYHAIGGKKSLAQLVRDSTTTTLQGNPVLAMTEGFKVRINGQRVDYTFLPASNGVIHPIEGVLLPPTTDINIDSLVDVLVLDGRFTTLIAAVTAAGLADTLATGGPFTVFAPTDAAFAALPPGTVNSLLADIPALQNVLQYHVLGEPKSASKLLLKRSAETLQGADVTVSLNRTGVLINQSRVLNPNVNTPNGIIHVIDAVLLPPSPKPNLIATLENDGRFTTLLTALEIAGLKDTVATGGTFTIFAPTDAAFAALPPGTVESLVTNVPALQNILLYHVVEGNQSARELLRARKIETLQGGNVRVYKSRDRVFVNRSQVITADVTASNGTIHAINQVLLPPAH
jgi:transforming growth factor-beta-induced protein